MENFVFGFLFGTLLTFFAVYGVQDGTWKQEMIDRGYAQYCQDTGEWAWLGDCKE